MSKTAAILGTGYIADWHAKALRSIRVPIIAACDLSESRARGFADAHRIPAVYTDLAEMLAKAKPEVVHVLTPPEHHFAVTEQVLRAGVHALVEKPLCLTPDECRRLGTIATECGRALGVGHNFLYAEPYRRLYADVQAGRLGRLDAVHIVWNKELGQVRAGPFGQWMLREPANVMLEVGPHSIAQALDLCGDLGHLSVEADRDIELPNGCHFRRRWRCRATAGATAVDLSWSFEAGPTEHFLRVRGSAGVAVADFEANTYVLTRPGDSGQGDVERWRTTASAGETVADQGLTQFARYALSKLKLSHRGSPFGASLMDALAAFYDGLPTPADERLSAGFAARVVATCIEIGSTIRAGSVSDGPTVRAGSVNDGLTVRARSVSDGPASERPSLTLPAQKVTPDTLVLGGTGFIGQALVRKLVESGRSVRLLARDPVNLPLALRGLPLDAVRGDITDAPSLERALDGIRDVVHLARSGGVTWAEFQRLDIDATRRLAEMCLAKGVRRLLYTGTIDSYDRSDPTQVITEDTPLDPNIERRNAYARAKAAAERLLMDLHATHKLPVVIARPGVVVGVGGSPFHWGVAQWPAGFIGRFWGRGDNPLPLVLVDDVARGLVRMLEVEGIEGQSFNLVADSDITAREYVAALDRAVGGGIDARPKRVASYVAAEWVKYAVKVLVRHPKRARPSWRDWKTRGELSRFDCTKAKRVLGWQPVTDRATLLREGVELPAKHWMQ
ncbi:MAG: NAD-dependent epimerase/dehydratase family protein [Gemmataceae bacterium]